MLQILSHRRDALVVEYAQRRQRFLAEQGYAYRLTDATEILATRT
jgi:DNA excision repair protein ERCC-3